MKTIGITQTDSAKKNALYSFWIKDERKDIEIIQLSYKLNNLDDLKKCDGIVMSGGVDVHPKHYNNRRLDYPPDGAKTQFNETRDEFEIKVFKYALTNQLPVLAICRGMQLVNCILGGDLIQDIEETGKQNHSQVNKEDISHGTIIETESLLHQITQTEKGEINSAHHQALGKIASELMVSATSLDGVVEAAEYRNKENKPYLLCVQWHPERLTLADMIVPFSKNIRDSFLESIKK